MRNKIIIFFVCTLLIITIIPASGLTGELNNSKFIYQDPNQSYREKVKHLDDGRLAPEPGDIAEDFVFEVKKDVIGISNPPTEPLQSSEETIIDILQNIDEDLVLGYLEDLVAFGPRVTGSSGCQQAGDFIYDEFVSYGLDARYDDWTYGSYSSNNIEGTLPGIDETSDEIYIICGHYDTVSGTVGADDDGSGTVAVLTAAKIMSQYEFNHTIRFVALSGEEEGLLGSYRYAEEAYGNGDNIVAVLNGDMIGYATNPTEASYMKIYENYASEWITDVQADVSQFFNDYIELTVVPSGSSSGSDHKSFWDFGYDAVFDHEYKFNPYWHTPQDTIANMDMDYCTRSTRLMLASLGTLAEAQIMSEPPETPSKPSGPDEWTIDIETSFSSTTTDPEGDSIYYLFDWGDDTDSGWVGLFPSGTPGSAEHTWTELGEYEIKVIAKDTYNSESEWSEPHILSIILNKPPNTPIIDGPKTVQPKKQASFTIKADDPENHDVYYMFTWGDGTHTTWLGPYDSGEEVTVQNHWNEPGSYTIKGQAKDYIGDKSSWAEYKITVTKNRAVSNCILIKLLENLLDKFPILKQILQI